MTEFVLEIEEYDLTAGVPRRVGRRASFFLLMTGQDVDLTFYSKGSRIGGGIGLEGGDAVGPLSRWYDKIEMTSATSQTVKIAVTSDPVTINRLSGQVNVVGDVSITGSVETTPAIDQVTDGNAFIGGVSLGAVAGAFNFVQLWNPSASTKNLVVLAFQTGTGQVVKMIPTAQEATNGNMSDFGERTAVNQLFDDPINESSENVIKYGNSLDNTELNTAGYALPRINSSVGWLIFSLPIILKPGSGIAFRTGDVNESMEIFFQYREVPA